MAFEYDSLILSREIHSYNSSTISRERHSNSNITKYLTRASRSNTGTRLKLKQFHRLLQDTTVLNDIFVTSPDKIVQSVMSTMEDTSDSDEEYVLKWKDSPGTVVYRSGSPLKERKEGSRFKVGLLGTWCVLYPLFFETSTLSNTRCPRIRRTRTLETSRYASEFQSGSMRVQILERCTRDDHVTGCEMYS